MPATSLSYRSISVVSIAPVGMHCFLAHWISFPEAEKFQIRLLLRPRDDSVLPPSHSGLRLHWRARGRAGRSYYRTNSALCPQRRPWVMLQSGVCCVISLASDATRDRVRNVGEAVILPRSIVQHWDDRVPRVVDASPVRVLPARLLQVPWMLRPSSHHSNRGIGGRERPWRHGLANIKFRS